MKQFIEESYIVAKTKLGLEDRLSQELTYGWKPYGPIRFESIRNSETGEYEMMYIQYVAREEPTTYNNWFRENRRLSINHLDD